MKKLKNLVGIEILSISERKSIVGGGDPGTELCYCPGTDILLGIIHTRDGESCEVLIDQKCPADS
ncbi:hypothetical protein [Flavobacterium sp. KACC 22761]|uniref:hypothetical protein n=1 Tax=Flavobacterium sp. KACC 22761 TaxID=3092665 RepID=UPI002A766480|nr:hypothetical protein [Flavobacterium sp. KACC 22761]WPO80372.1 hypothetical protein SCB73_08285 [Flavobacterium sp. KACC 22761]